MRLGFEPGNKDTKIRESLPTLKSLSTSKEDFLKLIFSKKCDFGSRFTSKQKRKLFWKSKFVVIKKLKHLYER